jgi:hypothetical protein
LRVSNDHRLANEDREGLESCSREEGNDEAVEDWVGTVELTGTVTVPPLSVRIAQARVIRRDDLAVVVKVPQNQVVMVDTVAECLPGIHCARLVATLDVVKMSSNGTRVSETLVVKNSPLDDVVSPPLV